MSTQTATQPGAVKITLHSANNDVDEKAEVTVALKHPEEAVAKMLRTLAQRFPPESVMTIQPTGADMGSRADYYAGSAVVESETLIAGNTSEAIRKNRDDSPLTQASSANGTRRNTPSRSKDSGPRIPNMGYNYPPNPVYANSQDGSQRKAPVNGSSRHQHQAVDEMHGPTSPSHMDGQMLQNLPYGAGGVFPGAMGYPGAVGSGIYAAGGAGAGAMYHQGGGMPPNAADMYTQAFTQRPGWPMMPPTMYPTMGYPLIAPVPGSPMVDAAGKFYQAVYPYPWPVSPGNQQQQQQQQGVEPQYIAGPTESETRIVSNVRADGEVLNSGTMRPSSMVPQNYAPPGGSQMIPSIPSPYETQQIRSSEMMAPPYDARFDQPSRALPNGQMIQGNSQSEILNQLQPGFGEYCHVGPDGSRTRYVEVEVVEEREVQVPKVEYRDVTRQEKDVKYETVVREVEEIEYVDEVIQKDKIVEQEREVKVPIKKTVEVPVERVTTKTVDVIDERVVEVEKPEIIEVEKFYTVEKPTPVARYNQKEVPCMVAQKLRPCVRSEGKLKVDTTTYEPVLYAVDVYIPKPVPNAIIPNGKIDETHQRVDVPAAQYNSLVHKLNPGLAQQVVNEVCLKTVEGHVPLLPAGELADIIPPIPGAWTEDQRGALFRQRGANHHYSNGHTTQREKKHKRNHSRKHRHHRD